MKTAQIQSNSRMNQQLVVTLLPLKYFFMKVINMAKPLVAHLINITSANNYFIYKGN